MNSIEKCALVLLLVGMAGCATRPTTVLHEPVGPGLAGPRIHLVQDQGQLVVYTAFEITTSTGTYFPTHAGYTVYDSSGNLIRQVDNRSGSFYGMPVAVHLPAGQYTVKAPATNDRMVRVPVIVKADQTTVLDLQGAYFRQHKPTGAGHWVRLPTGEVIGMRAP